MQCLGEMATWLPLPGAIPQYCARYTDEALGFAVGWNNWYYSAITLCAEISAAALVIQFWDQNEKYNQAIWISLIIIIIVFLNIFAVAIYGEAEFIFASIKILTILGLLLAGVVIWLGGAPDHDRRGFRYWKEGAMKEYVGTGNTGRFTGLWSTLVNAAFSYGGVEMVAVAAGEAENPRKNIPKAIRRVFWVSHFSPPRAEQRLTTPAYPLLLRARFLHYRSLHLEQQPCPHGGRRQGRTVFSVGHCHAVSQYPSSASYYQRSHLDVRYLIWQRFPLHRLPLSLRSSPERPGSQVPSQVL